MKLSIIIPVYYNEETIVPLYNDIKKNIIDTIDYSYEIVMVNDGSKDKSLMEMKALAKEDAHVKVVSLSRNFGSHAAILCGLSKCTGDCAVVKAADLQEPSELILKMVDQWTRGFNVVLAVRNSRPESRNQILFSNLYYWIVRKTALPNMPKNGFDIYLVDRKVIEVLKQLDEKDSALTGEILWCGFKTATVDYERKAREIGKSRWTFRKKIRLVSDTLFSFSTVPITLVTFIGILSCVGAIIWAITVFVFRLLGAIKVSGWTTLFIFNLFSFGVIMFTLGILGGYLWRTFNASRNRPTYIIEEESDEYKES